MMLFGYAFHFFFRADKDFLTAHRDSRRDITGAPCNSTAPERADSRLSQTWK
jgi:hypothetical protein